MEDIDNIANIDSISDAIRDGKDSFFFVPWIGKNYEEKLNDKKLLVVGASHYCNHSNVCIHPYNNKVCSNYNCFNRCKLGCDFYHDCTNGNTRNYNARCPWMKKEEYSKSYETLCTEISKSSDNNGILENLNSTTIGEVCNFLDPEFEDNKSFKMFTKFCNQYFNEKPINEIDYKIELWSHIAFVNYAQNFQPKSTGNSFLKTDYESFKAYIEMLKPEVVIVWGCALGGELEKQEFKKDADYYGYNWRKGEIQFVNSYHPSYGDFEDNGRLEEALNHVFPKDSKTNS